MHWPFVVGIVNFRKDKQEAGGIRADKTVCMCEMKWSAMPYAIKKAEDTSWVGVENPMRE